VTLLSFDKVIENSIEKYVKELLGASFNVINVLKI